MTIDSSSDPIQPRWRRRPSAAPSYGFCPHCGQPGLFRNFEPGSKDVCESGHEYWTPMATHIPVGAKPDGT